jgi:GR25 family glycosyltransferase involved in LPS biosynthesis
MFSLFGKKENPFQITIGIATFERRFEDYFVPLLTKIRSLENNAEIVVAVNGEHGRGFGEDYRRRILEFISRHQKIFPIFFPTFRSLSKLWNTILIHASNEIVLMLNDDTLISDGKFMNKISSILKKNGGRSFLINHSWSHFVARREEIADLGYFDERLLGIGEEDGDMTWRYIREYGAPMKSHTIKGFTNYAEDTMAQQPENIKCHSGSKYSLFNQRFVHEKKYEVSAQGIKGMFDTPMEMKDEGPDQYPNERFFREHSDEL